jgi:Cytochrome P450
MGDNEKPTLAHYKDLKFTLRCINESMRLYPHPPVLLRRALVPDELPGGYSVPKGQDVMISVYNIHRSPAVWDDADDFKPERFPIDEPLPTELNTDFRRASTGLCCCLPGSGSMLCAIRCASLVIHVCQMYMRNTLHFVLTISFGLNHLGAGRGRQKPNRYLIRKCEGQTP